MIDKRHATIDGLRAASDDRKRSAEAAVAHQYRVEGREKEREDREREYKRRPGNPLSHHNLFDFESKSSVVYSPFPANADRSSSDLWIRVVSGFTRKA